MPTPFEMFGQPAPVYRVKDVYGHRCYVRQSDYTDPRIKVQVPLATKEGVRWSWRTNKRGLLIHDHNKTCTIHRENIAEIYEVKAC
jgi:hypothetical protein